MCKKESVTIKIIKYFQLKKILLQHSVLNYQIDLYFSEHNQLQKLMKKDTLTEMKTKNKNKKKRKKMKKRKQIKKELGCKNIRINPDIEEQKR